MSSTRSPASARHALRLTAEVVLPTPPFWFATAYTRVLRSVAGPLARSLRSLRQPGGEHAASLERAAARVRRRARRRAAVHGRRATCAVARQREPRDRALRAARQPNCERAPSPASGPSTRVISRSTGSRASARAAPSGRPRQREPQTSALLDGSPRVHLVESGWVERMRTTRVSRTACRARHSSAIPRSAATGSAASQSCPSSPSSSVTSSSCTRARGSSFASSENLWPTWHRVVASSLEYSGIRLHNALPAADEP